MAVKTEIKSVIWAVLLAGSSFGAGYYLRASQQKVTVEVGDSRLLDWFSAGKDREIGVDHSWVFPKDRISFPAKRPTVTLRDEFRHVYATGFDVETAAHEALKKWAEEFPAKGNTPWGVRP
jgi:hypothetical protein